MNTFKRFFILAILGLVSSETFLEETFRQGSLDNWTSSKHREDLGELTLAKPDFSEDDEASLGIKTSQDARFYASSRPFDKTFSNKDKDLYIQFNVAFNQDIDCGGGYLKFLPKIKQEEFNGDSQYNVMFGPDVCGSDRKVHVILNHNGKNHQLKKSISVPYGTLTHQYTLIINKDKSYKVLIDNDQKAEGKILEDWEILPPKEIDDPNDKKPENWVDEEMITDPEDKKPEDWVEKETIEDPEAQKPEDWNDEDDGDWEKPMISNPEYKGKWEPKKIKNPEYKGIWAPKKIPNPDYNPDDVVAEYNFEFVGLDLWQVKSGTIIDNIVVSDDEKTIQEYNSKFEQIKKTEEENKKIKEEKEEEALKQKEAEEKDSKDEKDSSTVDVEDIEEDDEKEDDKDEL